jgi:hypothetical protein
MGLVNNQAESITFKYDSILQNTSQVGPATYLPPSHPQHAFGALGLKR